MKTIIRALKSSLFTAFLIAVNASSTWAGPIVWLLNPVSGNIDQVDPRNGKLLGSFAAPVKPEPGDTRAGLSIADNGRTLLYELGNNGPGTPIIPERKFLYGLDPFTGSIKFQIVGLGTDFGPDGISWESHNGSTFTFINHANPVADIHLFINMGTPNQEERYVSSGPNNAPYHSQGGLGGDGNGREFGVFLDINNLFNGHRFISEYFGRQGLTNSFVAPADDIVGLAFDGQYLYASGASGWLYTLDPDIGKIVNSVQLPLPLFSNGRPSNYKFDIAAAYVPEPSTVSLLSIAIIVLVITKRRGMPIFRRIIR